MALPDLTNEAMAHLEGEASGEPTSVDNHPDPSQETPELQSAPQEQEQTTAEAQAIADLSKFKEIMLDGQKISLDQLRKERMMQSDYTKKTQELARQRQEYESFKEEVKYERNIQADLEKVKGNPSLAQEFMRIYPQKYHGHLRQVMQQVQAQAPQANGIPFELQEKLYGIDQFIAQQNAAKLESEKLALEKTLETAESSLRQKYPRADAILAYTLAENHKTRIEQETGQKMSPKDLNEQFLEPFFKAAHEARLKEFNQWQKEQAKTARSVNRQASDVGRGGGTPGSAPAKVRLKDVADSILAEGNI